MLKSFALAFSTLLLSLFSPTLSAASAERMKSDLDSIANVFKNQYAMMEVKKDFFDWSLENQVAQAKARIDAFDSITQKDFQIILKDFFVSFHDYHVSVYFHSTESATLPFHVKVSQGRYFVTYIDEDKLSINYNSLNYGDEILTFDGRPIHEVVEELISPSIRDSYNPTDLSLAAIALTSRNGQSGFKVPKGNVTVTFISPFDGRIKEQELAWDYTPEKITNWFQDPSELSAAMANSKQENIRKFIGSKKMIFGDLDLNQVRLEKENDSKDLPGSRQSYLPRLGDVWWESEPDSIFDAYIYENDEGNRIGYLRIPNYSGSEAHIVELIRILIKFQEKTDALVIDQINNPGGDVWYCYAIASLLTERPLLTPHHREVITQYEVEQAVNGIEELEQIENNQEAQQACGSFIMGIPVDYQLVLKWLDGHRFIESEWREGKTFTDPNPLLGIDKIAPSPFINYTKPILILINELDFSGGDFFPAVLQDNGRATLFGTKTSGAGGYVLDVAFPNTSGIKGFRYTASLALRPDGAYLENLGVTPDIEYEIAPDDLQFGFIRYSIAINEAILDLIENDE